MTHSMRVKLIAFLVMVASIGSSGFFATRLVASTGRNELTFTNRAEDGDPPQVALGIAMGAFRGMFVNVLWLRANALKEAGKYYEAIELAQAITKLQPRFPRVWAFHAWNMAYNISVTTQTPEERWQWVNAGISLMRDEGLKHNPNDMLMHKELAWFYLHKIGGYTDDSNMYYKRQVAMEWTNVLGSPPKPDTEVAGSRSRDAMIALYVDEWMRPIVDANATLEGLRADNPVAGELADEYMSRLGEPLGEEFLRRVALRREAEVTGVLERERRLYGPRGIAFNELYDDSAYAEGWDDLIAHVRKRVLEDVYNMEPLRMMRLVEEFGPIDWRIPGAHALYWGSRGVDVGRMEVSEHNSDTLDFVNTFRVVMQAIQELWRGGDLYFNYLEVAKGRPGFYQAVPNPYFVESYGAVIEEIANVDSSIFWRKKRVYRPFAAGYENFLQDAVAFFYRRGDIEQAEFWYEKVRTWEGQNANNQLYRIDTYSLPLEEFVEQNLYQRFDSPTLSRQEVYASLQGAILTGLLVGDMETYNGMMDYAIDVHRYYMETQYRPVVATGGGSRTEYMDRDFRFVAGGLFANIVRMLPLDEAQLVYGRAPVWLRQYAYQPMREQFKDVVDRLAAEGGEPPFELRFAEPEGMEQFNAMIEQKMLERSQEGFEGLQQK